MDHMGVYAKNHWDILSEEFNAKHWQPPDGETFRLLFIDLPPNTLSCVFEKWMSNFLKDKVFDAALDGKACRGVINPDKPNGKGLEVLNVFAHDLQVTLTQWPLANKKGESAVAKANMEELIKKFPGIRILTGDAGLSGRNLCETIITYRKDYLIRIKVNQPEIEESLQYWFSERLKQNTKPDAKSIEKKRSSHYP